MELSNETSQEEVHHANDELNNLVSEGIVALMQSFSYATKALFEKSPIISNESNAFGDLPEFVQMQIVSGAARALHAQNIALLQIRLPQNQRGKAFDVSVKVLKEETAACVEHFLMMVENAKKESEKNSIILTDEKKHEAVVG